MPTRGSRSRRSIMPIAVSLALAESLARARRYKLLSFPNPSKVLPLGGALLLTACSAGYVVVDKNNNLTTRGGIWTGQSRIGYTVVPIVMPPGSGPLSITLEQHYKISQGQYVVQWVSGTANPYDHSKDTFVGGGIVAAIIPRGINNNGNNNGGHDYMLILSDQHHFFDQVGGAMHVDLYNKDILVSDNLNNQQNHIRISFLHEREANWARELYREAYAKEGRVPPWEETPASAGRN
jgi:hypothetical protein